jgi:hypothetical protein
MYSPESETMCRNIKNLRQPDGPPSQEEMKDAALQFVRKVSGYRTPSRANQAAFDSAVDDITGVLADLFDALVVR